MPAPRAVLADIERLGLNPKKSHQKLSKDGKIVDAAKQAEKKDQNPNDKAGFVFLQKSQEVKEQTVLSKKENVVKQEKEVTEKVVVAEPVNVVDEKSIVNVVSDVETTVEEKFQNLNSTQQPNFSNLNLEKKKKITTVK